MEGSGGVGQARGWLRLCWDEAGRRRGWLSWAMLQASGLARKTDLQAQPVSGELSALPSNISLQMVRGLEGYFLVEAALRTK
jgi:hypothetical protein